MTKHEQRLANASLVMAVRYKKFLIDLRKSLVLPIPTKFIGLDAKPVTLKQKQLDLAI